MANEIFDVAVIGGGITGAGVALDLSSRGLHVALIEKDDFASGTSSRSSKLIHGGLRYLEQFEFALVRESLSERAVLNQTAPHLCKPLEFLVPLYSESERSPLGSNRLKLAAGLWLYDLLAGSKNISRHKWISSVDALKVAPRLSTEGLRGAFTYFDCLTDDARLVIEVIKTASALGASVANYAWVRGFRRNPDGSSALEIEDRIGGRNFDLQARVVVNASGVWSDEVSRLSDGQIRSRIRPSKGIHIVVSAERLGNKTAVLIPSVGESRFLFVIPWKGRTVIGTTDADYTGSLDDPTAKAEEVNRVLQSAAAAFPDSKLSMSDVISTFAGLRPLISGGGEATKEISRKEEIFEEESGLITISGGKLTTWRRMAEQVSERVVCRIESRGKNAMTTNSHTSDIALANGRPSDQRNDDGFDSATVSHLKETYGGNYGVVLEIASESETLKARLVDDLPYIGAEVVYAARYEMAITVDDILARRTRITLIDAGKGKSCVGVVGELLKMEQGR
jgi:glycerol-3-phosphate dehydrogenase